MTQEIAIIIILILAGSYLAYYFIRSRNRKDKCESCRLKEMAEKK